MKALLSRFLLALGFLFLVQPAVAQVAVTDSTIRTFSTIGTEIQQMVDGHIDLFVSEGHTVLAAILAILLVYYFVVALFSRHVDERFFVELILNWFLADMMITFFDIPMPWGDGSSFHQLFSAEAQWAAATLDATVVNDVWASLLDIYKNMERPSITTFLDLNAVVTYLATLGFLVLAWLFTGGVTMIAHIALGFGALAGPLLIPFFIWPLLSFLFWGWVRFMITFSLYIFAGSAVTYLYAHVLISFFTKLVGHDYTIVHFGVLLVPFAVLNLLFLIAFWQVSTWARDLTSGQASMGSSVSGVVQACAAFILG